MKKALIVVSLLAASSVAVFAASAKTSKPVALNDAQMQAVKGQANNLYVFLWQNGGYSVIQTNPIGNTHYDVYQYAGGPLDGQSVQVPAW